MNEHVPTLSEENNQEWNKIFFVMAQRKKPDVVWISCDTYLKKKQVFDYFQGRFAEGFQHYSIDLAEWRSGSFVGFLQENTPVEILNCQPGNWIVHLQNLESHLIKINNEDEVSPIATVINFERELIFRSFPFFLIFWTNGYASGIFRRSAHDFWDWVANRFEFKSEPEIWALSDQEAIDKSDRLLKVYDPARVHRISHLRADIACLEAAEEQSEQEILLLTERLAREYYLQHDFERSILFFENAIQLIDTQPQNQDNRKAVLLRELGELNLDMGYAEEAEHYVLLSIGLLSKLAATNPGTETLQRDLGISLNKLGEIYQTAGRAEAAREQFEVSLEIRKKLAADNPGSETLQREVSMSLHNLGNLYRSLGQAETAREHFAAGLEITQKLAVANPDSETLQRDKSLWFNNLGNLLQESGHTEAAREQFAASLAIAKKLAAANPDSETLQHDVSLSLNKLGILFHTTGQTEAAREHFAAGREITQKLAAANPGYQSLQRDLSVSLDNLGNLYHAAGQVKASRKYFKASLNIAKKLAAANPGSTTLQRDVGVSLENLGNLYEAAGRSEKARQHFAASLEIARKLAAANPGSESLQRDLSVSLNNLGEMYQAAEQAEAARNLFVESLEIRKKLAAANPGSVQLQDDCAYSLSNIGDLEPDERERRRLYQEAQAIWQRLVPTGNVRYQRNLNWVTKQLEELDSFDENYFSW